MGAAPAGCRAAADGIGNLPVLCAVLLADIFSTMGRFGYEPPRLLPPFGITLGKVAGPPGFGCDSWFAALSESRSTDGCVAPAYERSHLTGTMAVRTTR